MNQIERMKKGGRLDPKLPHTFVMQAIDTDAIGGSVHASSVCGACGKPDGPPEHVTPAELDRPLRERHGPFGQ